MLIPVFKNPVNRFSVSCALPFSRALQKAFQFSDWVEIASENHLEIWLTADKNLPDFLVGDAKPDSSDCILAVSSKIASQI